MSEYKLDLSNCTNELPPKPITHEMFNKLIKQRDQYKAEREKFEQMLNEECERGYQMEGKYYDIKSERDSLIDDIAVLKANISRYRNRAENAMQLAESENCEVLRLERANAELMVVSNLYKTLTNHIRTKAEANPGVSRYIDLVNYIDRLEND